MTARTYNRVRPGATGVDTRLPWWALVLPAAAFVALLLLMAGPAQAHAPLGDAGAGRVLERIQQTLSL
ncbi:hypothetical protein [Streptomyces venezuelae]|uniref:hypothetical protein n=1 Tax=Streptomyces venezuelae TaxID=54571 RepID=UPI00278BB9E4|nr:hypothetical protein [Streptomyces venezuelae]